MDSHNGSDSSEEDSDEKSPVRGRTGKGADSDSLQERQVDAQITALMDENSKSSGA